MENASKALLMAGSVLLAIIIIGALTFMYGNLKTLQQTEASSEEVEKLAEYNRKIEKFNKSLYGSELLSLANLIEDYNERQADLKGYTAITLKVSMNSISGAEYIKSNYSSSTSLANDYSNLEAKVNELKAKTVTIGGTKYSYEKIAGMTDTAVQELLDEAGDSRTASQIKNLTTRYTNLKSEMTEFKNKSFAQPTVTYDNSTGRITSMIFTEN